MPEIIVMIGLPRSGKSTVARKLSEDTGYPILGRDYVREALHGTRENWSAENTVTFVIHTAMKALFAAGHKGVIIDECSVKLKYRNAWRKLGIGDVKFLHVDTPVDVCVARALSQGNPKLADAVIRMNNKFAPLCDDEPRYEYDAEKPTLNERCIKVINGLRDQQAMPDYSFDPEIDAVLVELHEA